MFILELFHGEANLFDKYLMNLRLWLKLHLCKISKSDYLESNKISYHFKFFKHEKVPVAHPYQ